MMIAKTTLVLLGLLVLSSTLMTACGPAPGQNGAGGGATVRVKISAGKF
jgi:hypothetical protein